MTTNKSSKQGCLFSGEELKNIPEGLREAVAVLCQSRKKLGLSRLQTQYLVKLSSTLNTRKDFLEAVTKQLSRVRYAKGQTQEVVNDKIGVADRLVNKWECGDKYPTAYNMANWAESLGCRLVVIPIELHLEVRELIEKWYEEN